MNPLVCSSFVPTTFKKHKCKHCGYLDSEHPSLALKDREKPKVLPSEPEKDNKEKEQEKKRERVKKDQEKDRRDKRDKKASSSSIKKRSSSLSNKPSAPEAEKYYSYDSYKINRDKKKESKLDVKDFPKEHGKNKERGKSKHKDSKETEVTMDLPKTADSLKYNLSTSNSGKEGSSISTSPPLSASSSMQSARSRSTSKSKLISSKSTSAIPALKSPESNSSSSLAESNDSSLSTSNGRKAENGRSRSKSVEFADAIVSSIDDEDDDRRQTDEERRRKEELMLTVPTNEMINNNNNTEEEKEKSPRIRAQTMESREQVGEYILIEKLGKGAYGVVYKALSLIQGNTVAIKQLNLKGASKEVVQSLQDEISLLKSLTHPNIVRYIGHIRKSKELSIVMEYVENGSLAHMVKKYGRFPESLTKTYTRKVLTGLVYLHEQGVIHRDIKPDNILITKEGEVKLADFGVSTKLSSLKNTSNEDNAIPAGTPYYMAPEVIEFYGARPESDVWSLGCTVVELLRGEPPYFSHDPFSAMYKMVEDDHPPLPSGISLALNDFLMLCFKKDVNMRSSASDLVKHNWLKAETLFDKQAGFTNIIDEIEEYNEELEREMGKVTAPQGELEEQMDLLAKSHTLTLEFNALKDFKNKRKESKEKDSPAKDPRPRSASKAEPATTPATTPATPVSPSTSAADLLAQLQRSTTAQELGFESVAELNWDEEFDLEGVATSTPLQLKTAADAQQAEEEDELDWDSELNIESPLKATVTSKAALSAWIETEDDNNDSHDVFSGLDTSAIPVTPRINSFMEKEEDADFGDDGFDTSGANLLSKLENKKAQEWSEWDEELIIEDAPQQDEKSILREKAQEALLFEIKELLQELRPSQDDDKIKRACLSLMEIFSKNPEMKSKLIHNHGLLPLISLLDHKNSIVVNSTLRLVTQLIESKEILVNLCVMGIIPTIMHCGDQSNTLLTRLYAAYFVQRVISTTETLQMFVACRGLSLLVQFLEPEYHKNKELVHIAIDCISSIFTIQGQTATPKNEYLHLFANAGLLERMSVTLRNLVTEAYKHNNASTDDDAEEDTSYLEKLTKICKVFSMGDSDVKLRICSKEVLSNIKEALSLLPPAAKELVHLLNMIRNISFDRHTLNHLAVLMVPLLDIAMHFVTNNEFLKEVFYQITQSMFHLCRLNRPRQEVAAKAGLIPFLKFVIANNKPLKDFAVPLMCELAGSSQVTRSVLVDSQGFHFYIDQLRDPKGTFQTDALEAVAVCLENERSRVEDILLTPSNLSLIIDVFASAKDHQLVTMLDSILKILSASVKINRDLGADTKEGSFVSIVKSKLHHPNPHARVGLLKSLNSLCSKYTDPPHFLKHNNLLKVVKFMASNDNSLLVKNMAKVLIKEGGKS